MMTDIVNGTKTLSGWTTIFLALPIFVSSAVNPWVYGYRNSEVIYLEYFINFVLFCSIMMELEGTLQIL